MLEIHIFIPQKEMGSQHPQHPVLRFSQALSFSLRFSHPIIARGPGNEALGKPTAWP